MKLSELLSGVSILSVAGSTDVEISGLSEDSRRVDKDFLFFARRGYKVSGLNYISEAIQKGAVAIITDQEVSELSVPVVHVSSMSEAQSKIADKFYSHPSGELLIVGVTGTNGKTTFTYMMESIVKEMSWRVGVIGTVNYRVPKKGSAELEIIDAVNTTPNPLELQKLLRLFVERETDLVVMEVSSHSLSLGRVADIELDGIWETIQTDAPCLILSLRNRCPSYFSPFKAKKMSPLRKFRESVETPKVRPSN